MADYVEKNDLDLVSQLNNFKTKLPNYAAAFGITQATLDSVNADAGYFGFIVSGLEPAKGYAKSWVDQKDDARNGTGTDPISGFPTPVDVTTPPAAVAPGIEKRFRNLAQYIKKNANYTTAIGEDLGIVAPSSSTELTSPDLSIRMKGGNPSISYVRGKSDGIRVYSKRTGDDNFSFLDVSTHSPYVDTRPNKVDGVPETREYYAFYIVDDQQVGNQSDMVSISVS